MVRAAGGHAQGPAPALALSAGAKGRVAAAGPAGAPRAGAPPALRDLAGPSRRRGPAPLYRSGGRPAWRVPAGDRLLAHAFRAPDRPTRRPCELVRRGL